MARLSTTGVESEAEKATAPSPSTVSKPSIVAGDCMNNLRIVRAGEITGMKRKLLLVRHRFNPSKLEAWPVDAAVSHNEDDENE